MKKRGRKIVKNAARCLNCGEVIESKSVHDWVCCSCFHKSDGQTGIFVDGGLEYVRCGGHPEYFEDLSETRPFTDEEVDEYNKNKLEQIKLFPEIYNENDLMEK